MSPEGRLADAGLPPALEDVGHARPILERLKDGPRLPKNPRQACGILSREPFQVVKGHEGTELASLFDGDDLCQSPSAASFNHLVVHPDSSP
jgi:hypothetical protein